MNAVTALIPALPVPSFFKPKTDDVPDVVFGPPLSFLFYGGKGTQKTLSLGQIVKDGFYNKVFYLNLDHSTEVWATDPEIVKAVESDRIHIETINTVTNPNARLEIEAMLLELAGVYREPSTGGLLPNPSIPNFGFDMIAIDTVNLLHEVGLKHFMATTYNAAGTKLDNLAAYGKNAIWMDEMLRLIHNSSRFTGGFVAHAKPVDEDSGNRKMMVKLSGAFKDSIATIPSIVGYLDKQKDPETGKVVLTATLGNSDSCDSGNRYNLPDKAGYRAPPAPKKEENLKDRGKGGPSGLGGF